MKRLIILAIAIPLLTSIGCRVASSPLEDRSQMNTWLVHSISETAIEQAVIAQHTLFPYHFVSDRAILNELGKHDLQVLAAHYKKYAGTLNIRQGNILVDLYEARVATVVAALATEGVERESITITNTHPGGDGMASERLVTIILGDETAPSSPPASGAPAAAGQTGASQ